MSVPTEKPAETQEMRRLAKEPVGSTIISPVRRLGLESIKRASSENKGTRLGTFLELLSWELGRTGSRSLH
jgi:hypothetical protein